MIRFIAFASAMVLFAAASPTDAQEASSERGPRIHAREPLDVQRVPTMDSRRRQNGATYLLATGAGLLLSSGLTFSYALPNRSSCSDERGGMKSLKGAAGFGSIGFSFAVGGGTWLGLESQRHGHYTSWQRRLGAAGTGALAFVVSQAALGLLYLSDTMCFN